MINSFRMRLYGRTSVFIRPLSQTRWNGSSSGNPTTETKKTGETAVVLPSFSREKPTNTALHKQVANSLSSRNSEKYSQILEDTEKMTDFLKNIKVPSGSISRGIFRMDKFNNSGISSVGYIKVLDFVNFQNMSNVIHQEIFLEFGSCQVGGTSMRMKTYTMGNNVLHVFQENQEKPFSSVMAIHMNSRVKHIKIGEEESPETE